MPLQQLERPQYVVFPARVARTRRLGPSFTRITFTGEQLGRFGTGGLDQRIKLLLPRPGRTIADVPGGPDWYLRWQTMPDDLRPTLRTYTVRAYRPEIAELDVDFVLHGADTGHGGPASTWAASAATGDEVALLGPDRPGSGRMWGCEWSPPETARHLVLAGDETAVPAMAAIAESLPASARGVACAEVPTVDDIQCWNAPPGLEIRWLVRQRSTGSTPHGALLEASVARALDELRGRGTARNEAGRLEDVDVDSGLLWEVPELSAPPAGAAPQPAEPSPEAVTATPDLYGWLAGEAGVIKRLRRLLVQEHRVPRSAVAFMGYWRQGRS